MAHILSASGALNATALTTFNVDYTEIPVTHISYQDCRAQVRRLQKTDSTWSGGPNFSAVYSDFWFDKVIENSSGLRLYHGATDDQVHESAFHLAARLGVSDLHSTVGMAMQDSAGLTHSTKIMVMQPCL